MPYPYSAPKSQGTSAASNLRRGQVSLKQHKMSHSWNFVTIWSVWWRPWKALLTGLVLIIAWPNLLAKERPSPGLCSDSANGDLNAGWSKHKDGQDLKRKIWGEKCPYGASQLQHVLEDLASCAHGQGCVHDQKDPGRPYCLTSGWYPGSVPTGNESWATGVVFTEASWQKVKVLYGDI